MSCKGFLKSKSFKLNMTDWPCYAWLQKNLIWPTNKAALGVCYRLLCTNLEDGIMCTLSPNQHVHSLVKNGIYQQRTKYSLKSKLVSKMHFTGICRSKFTELANKTVKKTQFFRKSSCKQKCLDKSLIKEEEVTYFFCNIFYYCILGA